MRKFEYEFDGICQRVFKFHSKTVTSSDNKSSLKIPMPCRYNEVQKAVQKLYVNCMF